MCVPSTRKDVAVGHNRRFFARFRSGLLSRVPAVDGRPRDHPPRRILLPPEGQDPHHPVFPVFRYGRGRQTSRRRRRHLPGEQQKCFKQLKV